ncbi:MAG TPA: protein phosphatase 2C domain-containing protein [Segeticoccus sp.]|uniref:PP2C family protein-serine/threonine phosphatase n=1 Tax=Segeticoccus sp. TaxID=2706531 RepID=UPI002D7FDC39|nr:protein phosphatase 2C domain-containing protein [Segeticoccus sp.]HET8600442.1 protein phosphatase 2C domain-containing protein [Segeticoccus sp.]
MTPIPTRQLRSGLATDVGRVRDHNEDHAVVRGTVFVVADGMGGHAAGEVASEIAATTLAELGEREQLTREDVIRQVGMANERILDAGDTPERWGMGTTVTGLAVVHAAGTEHWLVFNVGDSRVYRFADDRLAQVTVDHSEVRALVDEGLITEAEAKYHPARNIVTRSLGHDDAVVPDVWVFPPQPGERFLLCSDGLSNELSADEIEHLLRANDDVQAAAEALVRAAVEAGGRDNVTAIVVALDRAGGR